MTCQITKFIIRYSSQMAHKIASRGERLLQMITLDSMNFSLFEMSPVPYHIFMRSYARKNTTQVCIRFNYSCNGYYNKRDTNI